MQTTRITRLALTGALTMSTIAGSLSLGLSPSGIAHASLCSSGCDGGGGGGGGGTPDAFVVMGDSLASGEGGQWNGNPYFGNPDWVAARHTVAGLDNPQGTYGSTWVDSTATVPSTIAQGCHRSDVAEAMSANFPGNAYNLACSGAETINVKPSGFHGSSFKGEPPQGDQLMTLAEANPVKLIVLSIGGNDLHFSDIVTSCVTAYLSDNGSCAVSAPASIDALMPGAMANVAQTIADLEQTMTWAGRGPSSYRLVLQGYPSAVPPAATFIADGVAGLNRTASGCPLNTMDADWAHNTLVPTIDNWLQQEADNANRTYGNVQFLDLRHLFDGHELCSTLTTRPNVISPPNSATNEWARALSYAVPDPAVAIPNLVDQYGFHNESFHPDAFGQEAIGQCVAEITSSPPLATSVAWVRPARPHPR